MKGLFEQVRSKNVFNKKGKSLNLTSLKVSVGGFRGETEYKISCGGNRLTQVF